ncbi:MAG: FCD domain-containing protein, partial [Actinobacteria bacterium]|nr:FCD domain-containing protein [Actinomycetota bacterium]
RQQRLIETNRKGGTRVKAFSVKAFEEPIGWQLEEQECSFEELIRARAILESGAAGEAAMVRTARDLLRILDAIEQMEAAEADSPEHHKADAQFHLAILQATNNQALLIFGKLIAGQFNRKMAIERLKSPSVWKRSIAEHRAIFQFIEQGDLASAKKEMFDHILRQRRSRNSSGNSSKRS